MIPRYIQKADLAKTYRAWCSARNRCNNPNNDAYDRYGGRGIEFSEEWNSFQAFFDFMGECPEGLSLDRIDNNKGYFPGNCRWATDKEQCASRRVRSDNISGVKGLHWNERLKRWYARRTFNGVRKVLYSGNSIDKALAALEKWESEHE